jgi:nucleotide-binding universal stress UspA family protein
MFKNLLVGVDGRPGGRDALALARRLSDPDGRLTLAHVHSGEVAKEREGSRGLLEQERAAAGVQAELIGVISASPGRGLHEQAQRLGADLLVVGSCRHGVLGRAMLGDDTRAALNDAPCAVAVASVGYSEHAAPLGDVGVAYNSSPESRSALALARSLAARTGATVHALEVVSIPSYTYTALMPPAIGESIDVMLQEANDRMNELPPDVDAHAVYGLAGEELAAFGEAMDILVVGSRSYGPVRRLVLGSTSAHLQRHARCSLLVLPRTAAAGSAEDSAGSSVS